MMPLSHISPEDLALYAMQLLSSEEAAPIAQHLKECPECRTELAAVNRDLALYSLTAEMQSPPAQARQRLMKQVARERRAVAAPVARPHFQQQSQQESDAVPFSTRGSGVLSSYDFDEPAKRNVFTMVLPWAGWAVAAGVSLFSVNLYHQGEAMKANSAQQQHQIAQLSEDAAKARAISDMLTDTTAMRVTMTRTAAPAMPAVPIARVTYQANKGMLLLQANNMEPLQPYKTYELWLIPADGHDPMPAGTFQPDMQGNVSMVSPEMQRGVIAKEFGITVEDQGGSKVPSAPIIMVGL